MVVSFGQINVLIYTHTIDNKLVGAIGSLGAVALVAFTKSTNGSAGASPTQS